LRIKSGILTAPVDGQSFSHAGIYPITRLQRGKRLIFRRP
jgi:hypothetical protein